MKKRVLYLFYAIIKIANGINNFIDGIIKITNGINNFIDAIIKITNGINNFIDAIPKIGNGVKHVFYWILSTYTFAQFIFFSSLKNDNCNSEVFCINSGYYEYGIDVYIASRRFF
ncbi:MAG: hypothetical protein AAB071_07995, partial [Bacteroidota bacterium]